MLGNLHQRVLNDLGSQIVSGTLAAGSTMLAEQVEHSYGVSRSVVREAVRVLQSLGLVDTVKRVGIRVMPMEHWNLLDPLIIRWRLAYDATSVQLRALTELRSAVEPRAAALAARFAPEDAAGDLLALAARMRAVGRSGNLDLFLELDIRFHTLVLAASGNEMFARLDGVISEMLTGRTGLGLMPDYPHEDALQLHVDVADAIQGNRPDDASAAMEEIMTRTAAEMESAWKDSPRFFL